MDLFSKQTCSELPLVSDTLREEIISSQRSGDVHRLLMSNVAAMPFLEVGPVLNQPETLDANPSVVAWNLERCIDVEGSAALLKSLSPDIILLSEMDCGMARTQQRHTTKDLAALLDMNYIYGVEFYEVGLGSGPELEFATDDFNARGWHGNAILCKAPPKDMALIRLDDHGHWFCESDGADQNQPRIGGRMAISAIYPTTNGDVCVVSTHLESAGSISIRQSQIDRIISAVDVFATGLPVICGGDLNTGNNLPDFDWNKETLFEAAQRQRFDWSGNPNGTTTRPSKLTRFPTRKMKLDWFMSRDASSANSQIIPALNKDGSPLSDHDLISATFSLNE